MFQQTIKWKNNAAEPMRLTINESIEQDTHKNK